MLIRFYLTQKNLFTAVPTSISLLVLKELLETKLKVKEVKVDVNIKSIRQKTSANYSRITNYKRTLKNIYFALILNTLTFQEIKRKCRKFIYIDYFNEYLIQRCFINYVKSINSWITKKLIVG